MQKIIHILIICILLSGCASIKGPISGKNYLWDSDTSYIKEKEAYLLKTYPSWPKDIINKIAQGKLFITMSKEQAILALGEPKKISQISNKNITIDKFYYSMQMSRPIRQLYFIDGKLIHYVYNNKIYEERNVAYVLDNFENINPSCRNAILSESLCFGMDKQDVIASLGDPTDINRTITPNGTSEQWIYGSYISYQRYLYFEDGKLDSIQD